MPKSFPAVLAALSALVFHASGSLSQASPADGDPSKFLNFAIYELPPKYFADIALDKRSAVLKKLSTAPGDNRIDYRNAYLRWSSLSGRIKASSQLWLKLLPRETRHVGNRHSPYVFVHMSDAAKKGPALANNQTYVLRWQHDEWEDVTEKFLPKGLDRKLSLRPEYSFPGFRVFENDGRGEVERALYVWQGNAFHERALMPHNAELERPFDAEKLAVLALKPERNQRDLAELIVHAGVAKDTRFRYLFESEELNRIALLSMALSSYRYAIDRDPKAVDFIVRRVAEEGRGDTNSLWMMSYFDEWEKTTAAHEKFGGGDGAAGEAAWLWMETRKALYPENYAKWVAKREQEREKP